AAGTVSEPMQLSPRMRYAPSSTLTTRCSTYSPAGRRYSTTSRTCKGPCFAASTTLLFRPWSRGSMLTPTVWTTVRPCRASSCSIVRWVMVQRDRDGLQERMYVPACRIRIHVREALLRLFDQSVLGGAFFQLLPVKSAGLVHADHAVEVSARFANGHHHIFGAQPAQQEPLFRFYHFFLLMLS